MAAKSYFVYILSSLRGTLYTGVTNDLDRRMVEYRSHSIPGFTARYKVDRLIYFEETSDIYEALSREKQIKAWPRQEKLRLVRTMNPRFKDLWEEYGDG